jgi:hypothetical protein
MSYLRRDSPKVNQSCYNKTLDTGKEVREETATSPAGALRQASAHEQRRPAARGTDRRHDGEGGDAEAGSQGKWKRRPVVEGASRARRPAGGAVVQASSNSARPSPRRNQTCPEAGRAWAAAARHAAAGRAADFSFHPQPRPAARRQPAAVPRRKILTRIHLAGSVRSPPRRTHRLEETAQSMTPSGHQAGDGVADGT